MKAVKAAPVNIKNVALITVGGAGVMLLAAQILAKPNVPTVAKAISSPAPSGKREPSATATATTTKSTAPVVVSEVPHLKVAADPPIRELFHPLVSRVSATPVQGLPQGNAPRLPNAGPNQPNPIIKPDDKSKTENVTPPAPVGPRVSDIRMIGLVEIGGEPKALLKNTVTGERRYFTKGEDAFGFKVGEIKETETSLIHDGRTERVVMDTSIIIDGPGGAVVASNNAGNGFSRGGFDRGSFSRGGSSFSRGGSDRSSRGGNSGGSDRGSRGGGGNGGDTGFSTAQIFSLPTWAERLKKLDEVKAQIEPEKYDRLRKFMADKAAEEAKEKK